MSEEPELCPKCEAKMSACFDRLETLVSDMAGDLEPWQLALLLVGAAGNVAGKSDVPVGEFLTMVRSVVGEEYGVTIAGIAFDNPDFATEGEA